MMVVFARSTNLPWLSGEGEYWRIEEEYDGDK